MSEDKDAQQGGSGDRHNMDSISGWAKHAQGSMHPLYNRIERHRRNRGEYDDPGTRHHSRQKKSEKKKKLRHLIQKFMHDVRQHLVWLERDRKHNLRMIEEHGPNWDKETRGGLVFHRCCRSWYKDGIKKLAKQIRKAGGDPDFRRLSEEGH